MPACMMFDDNFIGKLRKGDRKSFEKLFLNTYESLCEYSASITKSAEDAEGVVQDIFAILWHNRSVLDTDVNIRAYLFRAVKNRSLDVVQHHGIRQKYHSQMIVLATNNSSAEECSNSHLLRRVREEVRNLPEKNRTVYLLHRRDGLTYAEIATVLDISVKTVEARMSRALKQLRSRLENEKDLHLLPLLAILYF